MPQYSFQKRFAPHIISGRKAQTIRRVRTGRTPHASAGDTLHLFTGLRTKHTQRLGAAICVDACPIVLELARGRVTIAHTDGTRTLMNGRHANALDRFAWCDGFDDWADLCAFWASTHDADELFAGVIITWRDFVRNPALGELAA